MKIWASTRFSSRWKIGRIARSGSGASGAAQHGHAAVAVEHRRQPVEIGSRGDHDRLGGSKPASLGGGASEAGCKATSPGITTTDTPRSSIDLKAAEERGVQVSASLSATGQIHPSKRAPCGSYRRAAQGAWRWRVRNARMTLSLGHPK